MDVLKRALATDKETVFIAIDATELIGESLIRIGAWPPAMLHLGQALMGSVLLMSITSKEDTSKISLQWSVKGPFGELFVESNARGQVRGTILNPQVPVQNMHAKLGKGVLQVRRTTSSGTFTGVVESQGDACNDILEYLKQSEQRNCAMNLWVDMKWDESDPKNPVKLKHAYGYLLEALPTKNHKRDAAKAFFWEERLRELGGLSTWNITEDPTASILNKLSDGHCIETLFQSVNFFCPCTEERAKRALVLAKNYEEKDLEINNDQEVLKCEFCGKTYTLSSTKS